MNDIILIVVMRHFVIMLPFISTLAFAQVPKVVGTYSSIMPKVAVTFNADSTFQYVTKEQHPTFYRWEDFSEKGKWALSGDTIILNPELTKKVFVESEFREEKLPDTSQLFLTFRHIKRYFNASGDILKSDTLQIESLDYSFNELKKRNRTRVAARKATRCTFAGYIPKEIITTDKTISVPKPAKKPRSIFIGCSELQGTKEFTINDPNSNHLTLNVYSNYYQDGQIRQMKFLVKNKNVLYTKQNKNGQFKRDNIWAVVNTKLKRQKDGS